MEMRNELVTVDHIRLNRRRLEVRPGKPYAELLALGDIHEGHPNCDIERVLRQVEYCVEKGVHVIGMGDYIEAGLRGSVGDSVYMQNLNPQRQKDFIREHVLGPLAAADLLVGIHIGNHEGRILKNTSINIVKDLAREFEVPYLGYACWNLFYVGKQSYTVYSIHGTSGARFEHTKLKAALDIARNFGADLSLMGHVHTMIDDSTLFQDVDRRRKAVVERKAIVVITGHYLRYDNSYAQEKGFSIGKMGSPKIELWKTKKDIHISK